MPQQDFIQWNGIVKNQVPIRIRGQETDFGALGRNVGEVIGVFGELDVRSDVRKGYPSSIKVANLIEIERRIAELRSPQWPPEFPPISDGLRAKGEVVFRNEGCGTCHSHLAADDLRSKIKVQMSSLMEQGTDIGLACNTFLHRSRAQLMEGQRSPASPMDPIPAETETHVLLEAAVIGAILGRADDIASTLVGDVLFGGNRLPRIGPRLAIPEAALLPGVTDPEARKRARQCLGEQPDNMLRYKARPLNGIWATAPYLHNGSVPTLYDLLLPSTMRVVATGLVDDNPSPARPLSFPVGQSSFDPVKVGYAATGEPTPFVFETHSPSGEPILGNYNSGHTYGTDLSEADRVSLVEYLKSL